MGYYTNYTLSISKLPEHEQADRDLIERRLNEISGYDLVLNERSDDIKWYNHETDMEKLSQEFPNLVFSLAGSGEDRSDVWIDFYCNGFHEHFVAHYVVDVGGFTEQEFLAEHGHPYLPLEDHLPKYEYSDADWRDALTVLEKARSIESSLLGEAVSELRYKAAAIVDAYRAERNMK